VLLEQRGDVTGAEEAYRRADERGDSTAAFNLGALLADRGDLAGAEEAYRRASERGDGTGAFGLGTALAQRGDLAGAEAAYTRAAEIGPKDVAEMAHAALVDLRASTQHHHGGNG
jgi:tetratricopeptide (TPR) repeat protein